MRDMKLTDGRMPVSTPEEQGVSSASIIRFLEKTKQEGIELHSLQIARNGKLIADMTAAPYTRDSFHRIFSAAKGVVATGVLFAIQEGYFGLHDLVVPMIPEEWLPDELDEKWNKLTIYHLLTNNTGHDCDTLFQMWGKSDCWIKTFFNVRPVYEPGTYFRYDMGTQYVMNELVRLAVGQDMGQYLKPRLFDPLGIEYTNNYTEPEKLFFSSTIQFKPDALTKLAQFYLQKGSWEGKQLLSEELAVMAGAHHSPSHHYRDVGSGQPDSNAGYAFHMWRNSVGGFRFSGGQGQFGIVLPDENMAVGIMASEHNNRRILELFFGEVFADLYRLPRREDKEQFSRLKALCENWNLAPEKGDCVVTAAEAVNGENWIFSENDFGQRELKIEFDEKEARLISVTEKGTAVFKCGYNGVWKENHGCGYFMNLVNSPNHIHDLDRIFYTDTETVLLSGSWQSPDTFAVSLRSPALLCGYTYLFQFGQDRLTVRIPGHAVIPRNKAEKGAFFDIEASGAGQISVLQREVMD